MFALPITKEKTPATEVEGVRVSDLAGCQAGADQDVEAVAAPAPIEMRDNGLKPCNSEELIFTTKSKMLCQSWNVPLWLLHRFGAEIIYSRLVCLSRVY